MSTVALVLFGELSGPQLGSSADREGRPIVSIPAELTVTWASGSDLIIGKSRLGPFFDAGLCDWVMHGACVT